MIVLNRVDACASVEALLGAEGSDGEVAVWVVGTTFLPKALTRLRLLSPLVMKIRRGTFGLALNSGMHASVSAAVPVTFVS